MSRFGTLAGAIAVVGLTSASTVSPRADDVEDFYRGRTLEMHVGFGVGGGNDLWGRVVARHMSRFIAGNPTIIVKNVPAAGSLVVANYIANAAPRDGSVLGMIARGVPFEPLFEGKGVQFDPLQLSYIGSPSRDSNMCAVWHDRPIKAAQDFFTHETIMGSTGSGAGSNVFPLLLKNLLAAKVKIIPGYKGSQDIVLAIERGEVDALCLGTETVLRTTQYTSGKLRIILQMATEPDPLLPGVPLVTEYAKTAEDRAVLDLIFARVDLGRPFIAPPGVPAARISALRNAFMTMVEDPDFKKDVDKLQFDISAKSGADLEALLRKAYATPKSIVKRTAELLSQ